MLLRTSGTSWLIEKDMLSQKTWEVIKVGESFVFRCFKFPHNVRGLKISVHGHSRITIVVYRHVWKNNIHGHWRDKIYAWTRIESRGTFYESVSENATHEGERRKINVYWNGTTLIVEATLQGQHNRERLESWLWRCHTGEELDYKLLWSVRS